MFPQGPAGNIQRSMFNSQHKMHLYFIARRALWEN